MAFWTEGTNSVPVMPAPTPASTTARQYFQSGNPNTGQRATRVTQDMMNMLQEEILNAVVAAKLTPDKMDNTQLSQAIKLIAGDSAGGEIVFLTQAEYDALPDDKLTDGKIYAIYSGNILNKMMKNGVAYDLPWDSKLDKSQYSGFPDSIYVNIPWGPAVNQDTMPYVMPGDGWVAVSASSTTTLSAAVLSVVENGLANRNFAGSAGAAPILVSIQAAKGQTVNITGTAINVNYLRFIPAMKVS